MFRKSILLSFLLFLSVFVQAQTVNWEFSTGGSGNESPVYNEIYTHKDVNGNVYQGGLFASPTMDVDPSGATVNLINMGGNDGYFAKYSAAGNFLWAVKIGGNSNDGVHNICTDAAGNVYVTGFFNGTVDFDPSAAVFNLTASNSANITTSGDVFLAKYDPNGNFLWAFGYGGGTGYDYGRSLAVSPSGTVYVGGIVTMTGALDIDPSAAVFNLNVSGGNAFCAKYNTNGQFIAGFNIGAAYENSSFREMKLDNASNKFFAVGYIKGNCDIDPSSGVKNITSSSEDPFIIKLDTNFNFYWGFNIPTNSQVDECFSVSFDLNNVYISGYVQGPGIDFNPGLANTNMSSNGDKDIFVASYTQNGTYRWAKVIGGTGTDWSLGTALQGRFILASGFFHNTVDFDPSISGVQNMTSNGGSDGFCLKLDTNGFYQCKYQIGGTGEDHIHSMWFYAQNKMLINGTFSNTAHIPEPSGPLLLSQGNTDLFLADIDWACQACNVNYTFTDTLKSCKTIQFHAVNNNGDEAAQLHWNFGDGNTSLLTDPLHTYASTGTYTAYLVVVDSLGCKDSFAKSVTVKDFNYSLKDTTVGCKTVKLTAKLLNGKPAGQFYWYFGDNTSDTANPVIHQYVSGGSYAIKLIMTDTTGCLDTISYGVFVDDVRSQFTLSDDTVCQGDIVSFNNASSNNAISYFWNFGNGDTAISISTTYTYLHSGIFHPYLVVTNSSGCHDTAWKTVTVDSITTVDFFTNDSLLCEGQQVIFNALYWGSVSTGYEWDFGDGVIINDKNPISHAYDTTNVYTIGLNVHFRACPDASTSKNITINPYPTLNLGPDTSMCPQSVGFVLADVNNMSNSNATWLWNTGATTSSIFVGHPGIYTVKVSVNGCATNDTIDIAKDCYLDIPNAFTPDGDGMDDYFIPRNLLSKGLSEFNMKIYNRWGQVIFETNKVNGRGWDGKFNGEDQPMEAYIYDISVVMKNQVHENYRGNVTLIR